MLSEMIKRLKLLFFFKENFNYEIPSWDALPNQKQVYRDKFPEMHFCGHTPILAVILLRFVIHPIFELKKICHQFQQKYITSLSRPSERIAYPSVKRNLL